MARPPDDFRDHVAKLDEQRQEQFNRFMGCATIFGFLALIVFLLIGYWATH